MHKDQPLMSDSYKLFVLLVSVTVGLPLAAYFALSLFGTILPSIGLPTLGMPHL